jgi:hypothetical protein
MKGSPLLRALLAFVAIAMMGVPLLKVTRAGNAAPAPVSTEAAVAQIPLRLTFSTVPRSFAILHLGSVVWTDVTPATDVTKTVALAYPKEGVDLQVKVAWPADAGEAAVRVRLTDPDGNEHDKTVWGRGDVEDVVTFP